VDERLICMLIGMVAMFMVGLFFERFMARLFLRHTFYSFVIGRDIYNDKNNKSIVATLGTILSIYYNDNLINDLALEAKDKLSQTKTNKSRTEK